MKTSFLEFFNDILIEALFQTLYMTTITTILATILGFIINTVRSFPFIILMLAIIPFTRLIVGKSIGVNAALVPLTIGAAPFIARIIEGALKEVDNGLIEAAKSFGASNTQIIFKIMIKEAMPSIVSGITLSIISIIGYTAMAGAVGAVGAGGLGAVALTYGYQRFDTSVMLYTVFTLIIIVQLLQCVGNLAYKKLK